MKKLVIFALLVLVSGMYISDAFADGFHIEIYSPASSSENYQNWGYHNVKINIENFEQLIRSVDNPKDVLAELNEVIDLLSGEADSNFGDTSATNTYNSDGTISFAYQLDWVQVYTYQEINSPIDHMLRSIESGMGFEAALADFNFESDRSIEPIPDTSTHESIHVWPAPEPGPELTPEPISTSIVVTTDKPSYSEGEIIEISGKVTSSESLGDIVGVTVTSPNGNLVSTQQVTVGADKIFSTEITAGGPLMKAEGEYTVFVKYGSIGGPSDSTSFHFDGSIAMPLIEEEIEDIPYAGNVGPIIIEASEPELIVCEAEICIEECNTMPNCTVVWEPEPTPEPEPEELGIASFVDETKDPQSYVDRYNNEPTYKEWFDENFPQYSSIYEAVGLPTPIPEWVRGVFVFWANGDISDAELTSAIAFLVDTGVIVLNNN